MFLNSQALSAGSSTESDQTFHSSGTVLPANTDQLSPRVIQPDTCTQAMDGVNLFSYDSSRKTPGHRDMCIGTDDINMSMDHSLDHGRFVNVMSRSPTAMYHIHPADANDSGNETASEKSVMLTIEIPSDWINSGNQPRKIELQKSFLSENLTSNSNARLVTRAERTLPLNKSFSQECVSQSQHNSACTTNVVGDKLRNRSPIYRTERSALIGPGGRLSQLNECRSLPPQCCSTPVQSQRSTDDLGDTGSHPERNR